MLKSMNSFPFLDRKAIFFVCMHAGVPSMRRREKVVVQQPMGTITGQGPPGPGAPARYANIDPERGTARPRGRAY